MRLILAALSLAVFGASCDRLLPFGAPADGPVSWEPRPPRGDGRPDLASIREAATLDRPLPRELLAKKDGLVKKDVLPKADLPGLLPDAKLPISFVAGATFQAADLPAQVTVPSGVSLLLVQIANLGAMPPTQVTYAGTPLQPHMTGGNGSFATTWYLSNPPAGSASLTVLTSASALVARVTFVYHGAYHLGGGKYGDGAAAAATLPATCDVLVDVLLTYPGIPATPDPGQTISGQTSAAPIWMATSSKWTGQGTSWVLNKPSHWVLDVTCLTVQP